jgi:hypothetical protein
VRRHGHGVLLGADSPQISVELLLRAMLACDRRRTSAGHRAVERWRILAGGAIALPPANAGRVCRTANAIPGGDSGRPSTIGDWLVLRHEGVDQAICADAASWQLATPLPAQRSLGEWLQRTSGPSGRVEEAS